MNRFDIISIFPEMFKGFLNESVIKKAQQKGLASIHFHDLRSYGIPSGIRKVVDDYPYGGAAGMLLRVEPIVHCIEYISDKQKPDEIIYLSPDGEQLKQGIVNELSLKKHIVLLCGRYKGIDQRVRDHFITREISIGDYVISGGELAAAILCDAIIRVIPGVLSDECSALSDSFQNTVLDAPMYTRPSEFRGWKVPEVLLQGDHEKIELWQTQKALEKTRKRRPDLLK
jgi:tRNA (guanine37-N1)-methyltransferase